jgi:eukaryotic-like serine/threonine-protein kinase
MVEAAARTGRLPQLAKYEILGEIGHGGMATVYRARDRRLGREVAVKVIHPHLRDSKEVVSRFSTEAKAVAKLRHPNIVDVYDVSEADEPELYLVAELVGGTTLRKLLQQHGAMPPEIAAAVAIELLGALAHANANGVVHRDIKPENVLVEHKPSADKEADGTDAAPGGRRVVVKLTDFGIAKLLDAQGVTSTGQVLGSPAHMAPEQIEGGEVDARSDVFGLGVLMYECMVGHLPFEGSNPAQVLRRVLDGEYPQAEHERPIIGAAWSSLIDRALARAPAARFPDANAMKDAITSELARLGIALPADEFQLWLDDPQAYEAAHKKRLIGQLCALAAEEHKRGDAISSAADYNRALAHAPEDPQLLRIVAGIHRSESRVRTLRKMAKGLAFLLAVGLLLAGAGQFLRSHRGTGRRMDPAGQVVQSQSLEGPVASTQPAGTAPSASPGVKVVPLRLPTSPPTKATDRKVILNLRPPMGVTVSIDGQPSREVSTGDALTLDAKAHALTFSCPVCNPVQVAVSAAEKDSTVVVSVPVKAATLVVEGDLAKTYQIAQHPEQTVRAGMNTVQLKSAYERVTVIQVETGSSVSVRLEAGKTMRAAFE